MYFFFHYKKPAALAGIDLIKHGVKPLKNPFHPYSFQIVKVQSINPLFLKKK